MKAGRRVADRIRTLIKKRNTTAEKVAFEAEISKSYLSAILRGKKSPTVRTLEKIARTLEVQVRDLF